MSSSQTQSSKKQKETEIRSEQQKDIKEQAMQEEGMKKEGMKGEGMKGEGMKGEGMKGEGMKLEGMKKEGMKKEGMKKEGMKGEDKNKQDQFVDSVHKQIQELEDKFQKQISDLREMLFQGPKEKMQTEPQKMKSEIKPLNYEVSYSSASTYKDGKRDVKEHIEMKNPEMTLVADRVPDKEEFEVKIKKQGEQQPITKKLPAKELQKEIDSVYHDLQKKTKEDSKRLGLPMGRSSRSLFGSHDLPMLESSTSRMLPIEKESGISLGSDRSLATRPIGTDFFTEEVRNIEREMDFMSRRMEDEMRRFFD